MSDIAFAICAGIVLYFKWKNLNSESGQGDYGIVDRRFVPERPKESIESREPPEEFESKEIPRSLKRETGTKNSLENRVRYLVEQMFGKPFPKRRDMKWLLNPETNRKLE